MALSRERHKDIMPMYGKRKASKKAPRSAAKKSKTSSSVLRPGRSYSSRLLPFGGKLRTTLKYAHEIVLDPGISGVLAVQAFSSSLYDPDNTGVGHQPMFWDQLIALFERCTAYGVAYRLSVQAGDGNPVVFGVIANDQVLSAGTDYGRVIENGDCQWTTMQEVGNGTKWENSGYIDFAKLQGMSLNAYLASPEFSSTSSSNPTDLGWMNLFAAGCQATNTAAVVGTIELTYYVEFQGSQITAQS